jgi:hypothetical protein
VAESSGMAPMPGTATSRSIASVQSVERPD